MTSANEITPGTYRHYKGNLYSVVAVAKHSESLESLVIYQGQYEPYDFWARPLAMFQDIVEREGRTVPRFQRVEQ